MVFVLDQRKKDLKPQNILLSDEQKIRICDFGLSKVIDENQETIFDQCQLGGTIEYCAPEQIQYEPVSDKTDIWSLGKCRKFPFRIILYFTCNIRITTFHH